MKYLELGQKPELMEQARSVQSELSDAVFRCPRLRRLNAGGFLYTEGKRVGCSLILLTGSCKVFKILENGRIVLSCLYDDTQVTGEFGLLDDPIAKTDVQVLTETYCLAAFAQDQQERLFADNPLLQFVYRQTCAKADRNSSNTATNLLYPLEQRLVGYVFVMQKNGVFSANYTLLAESLDCSLRHLLRTFRNLCDKGLLQKIKAGYRLANTTVLEKITGNVYRQQLHILRTFSTYHLSGSSCCEEPLCFVLTGRRNSDTLFLRSK